MFGELLLAASLQVGPFWQQWEGHRALCPFWSEERAPETYRGAARDTTDVLWPIFTSHRDWWRFCWFTHYQRQQDGGWQFEIIPLWFNGNDPESGTYWGLFPLWGHHPHVMLLNDWDFCLWPLWMRYRTPRPSEGRWMTTNAVLFPLFHWRDDGSWGVWPLCGVGRQRESVHRYALWPIATWARYEADRDTAGAGHSWMFWPLWARVSRERETQTMFLPPFFSWAETRSAAWSRRGNSAPEFRLRCPWPLVEYENGSRRERLSLFPLYEHLHMKGYSAGEESASVMRFGWRLAEFYFDGDGSLEESRVFPLWTKGRRYFRIWPLWASEKLDASGEVSHSRVLELFPIRWVDAIDRNWAPYWTFYEAVSNPVCTEHSLFWGIFRWRTFSR